MRFHAQAHFRAGPDQDYIRGAVFGFRKNISASRDARFFGAAAIEVRHYLSRQHERGRTRVLHRERPGFGSLVRIGGTEKRQIRQGAQSGELFHRFMRGAVFAEPNAIVREHVDRLQMAQRTQADGGLHVIREIEKGRAERQHAAMRGHSVDGGAHGMLANAESDVPSGITPFAADSAQCAGTAEFRRLEIAQTFQSGIGGRIQIRRPANDVGNMLGQRIERRTASRSGRDGFIGRSPMRKIGGPAFWQRAADDLLELGGFLWKILAIVGKRAAPLVFDFLPFRDSLPEVIDCVLGKIKLVHSGPTQRLLGGRELFFTQGTAVRGEIILLVRAAVANMSANQNQ